MRPPHLSVIIPVLNQWHLTKDCLASLREHTPGGFFEVVVVDNGSGDETPRECPPLGQALFGDRFRYVRSETNLNFGPGCNLGAQHASGELLFFLNNDTLLLPSWSAPLLKVFSAQPDAMAASPLCLFPDNGRVQHLGIAFDGGLNVRHPYFLFPGDHPVVRRQRRLQALSGAALMTPAKVFRKLGGLFPGYANGYEDMDLCCRMVRAGGRLVQENASAIHHLASQTPGRNTGDGTNSRLINQRCAAHFRPDLHSIAARDGYACELTPWLAMVVRQPDTALLAACDALEEKDEIAEALHGEPLWECGYDKLAALLAAQGDDAGAVEYLRYGATLFPDMDRLARLAQAATKAGDDAARRYAEDAAAGIRTLLAAPDQLVAKAQTVLSFAQDNNDKRLAAIYSQWMEKHAPARHAGDTPPSR